MADEFVGPPQKSQFDNMTPEQRAQADKYLAILDGIKLYRAAGGAGVGTQWAPYAAQLEQAGGLTEEQALNLARYRMWKQGMPVPQEKAAPLTEEQIAQNRDRFIKGTPEERQKLLQESDKAIWMSHQNYYDAFVKKPEQKTTKTDQPQEPTS